MPRFETLYPKREIEIIGKQFPWRSRLQVHSTNLLKVALYFLVSEHFSIGMSTMSGNIQQVARAINIVHRGGCLTLANVFISMGSTCKWVSVHGQTYQPTLVLTPKDNGRHV